MEYMIVHIKTSIYLVVLSFLLTACGIPTTVMTDSDESYESVSVDDLFGLWSATSYLTGSNIQTTDFTPDKYIGNTMSIEKDTFNMGHWSGILPAIQVEQYVLLEEDINNYIIENGIEGDLGLDEEYLTILYYETVDEVREEVGIVLDASHLICPTGTGWYLYEPVLEE